MRPRLVAVAALSLALGMAWAPAAVVYACSCAGVGGPVDFALAAAREPRVVAVTGRVVDARAAPDGVFGGPVVAYSFEVERASEPVPSVLEIRALDDGGGAACGFTFGIGEVWFVTAYPEEGALHTGLCNGNARTDELDPATKARLAEALPEVPDADAATADPQEPPWSLLLAVAAALAVGAVAVIAFRTRGN
jgi:hypothetical protein